MMKVVRALLLGITAALVLGCGGKGSESTSLETLIDYNSLQKLKFSDLPDSTFSNFVILKGEDREFMIGDPENLVKRAGNYYIYAGMDGKIVRFSLSGDPLSCLSKKGRGPGEYLSITDFDVDGNGNIWILDGRARKVLEYDKESSFIKALDLPFAAEFIKCLEDGGFIFGLAPWNEDEYKGMQLAVTNQEIKDITLALEFSGKESSDFEFLGEGLDETEDGIIYHRPICDTAYVLAGDGSIQQKYVINFKDKTVPDDVRTDPENNIDKLDRYLLIAKAFNVYSSSIAGSFRKASGYTDFIIDTQSEKIYEQDDEREYPILFNAAKDELVFIVTGPDELPSPAPADVAKALSEGQLVLATVKPL